MIHAIPNHSVTIVGAGLAGCEAAIQLAIAGVPVDLYEMKPKVFSPAHCMEGPAELVCSNSLKSDSPDTAHGLLKSELRALGSAVMRAAHETRVPAGSALAVDRNAFSMKMKMLLAGHSLIRYYSGVEVESIPGGDVIIATGPLTSQSLTIALQQTVGDQDLHFYDALAPIIDAESIEFDKIFEGSRWGKGDPSDYLNCPLSKEEYLQLVLSLRNAEKTPLHGFEKVSYFEGCLPIEVMAERGDDVLAFGPLRPVGLECQGKRPYAVVQLRSENRQRTAFNMVGFQTKLTHSAQKEVFRKIPGLNRVRFLRFGAVHRNMYINAPDVLTDDLALKNFPNVRLAGQITGVEGYVESAAMGLLVGLMVAKRRMGKNFVPPPGDTAMGALYRHIRQSTPRKKYEPMNIHFGLLPQVKAKGKKARRQAALERARSSMLTWLRKRET